MSFIRLIYEHILSIEPDARRLPMPSFLHTGRPRYGMFLLAFMAAFLLTFNAYAACSRDEMGLENWYSFLRFNNPLVIQSEMIEPDKAVLTGYYGCAKANQTCPPDRVMVYTSLGNNLALVVFVKKGCVTLAEEIDRQKLRQLMFSGTPIAAAETNPPFTAN